MIPSDVNSHELRADRPVSKCKVSKLSKCET